MPWRVTLAVQGSLGTWTQRLELEDDSRPAAMRHARRIMARNFPASRVRITAAVDSEELELRRSTHGRCRKCERRAGRPVVYRWTSRLRLRDASCPECGEPLQQTTARLIRRAIVQTTEPARRKERR